MIFYKFATLGNLMFYDWATSLSLFTFIHWRRKWQPTPVFLPGESQGRGVPGGLPSMRSHRVGHDWSDLAAAAAASVLASQVALVVKNRPANAGDGRALGSIPGLGSFPGGGHGNPLWYSCLENPMDRGAWWARVHGVSQSRTRLKEVSITQYVCWYIRRTLYQTSFYLPPWHHLTLLIPSPSQKALVQRCSKITFFGPIS